MNSRGVEGGTKKLLTYRCEQVLLTITNIYYAYKHRSLTIHGIGNYHMIEIKFLIKVRLKPFFSIT